MQKPLGYEYDALEPYIDAKTMELHYSKHHAGYTAKFNAAAKEAGINGLPVREIFANVSKYSSAIRNNGGGYYNHNLFWKVMSPDGGGQPDGELMGAIEKEFGSFESFKEQFSKAAATVFGSGWAWLILQDGKLKITQTSNQDNPLMDICAEKGYPLLTIDVWEHAYYLNYQNMRTDYITAFWNVVNWEEVGKRFKK
ncbi:MAG: superoxide dismutase [Bacteroidales bacterium]|nr:superoxide dismutase [Bacteroidales bacterium]MCF8390330.1 superoxide dismutase [Bacteroidales bacterium]